MSAVISLPHPAETTDTVFEGAPQAMLVIDPASDRVLDANPAQVAEFRAGKESSINGLIGPVMKAA